MVFFIAFREIWNRMIQRTLGETVTLSTVGEVEKASVPTSLPPSPPLQFESDVLDVID